MIALEHARANRPIGVYCRIPTRKYVDRRICVTGTNQKPGHGVQASLKRRERSCRLDGQRSDLAGAGSAGSVDQAHRNGEFHQGGRVLETQFLQ